MKKRDWLLLAIGDQMQPIQIQKTLFKFARESGIPKKGAYRFVPYDWGPCSFEIYDDLGELRELGLIETIPSGRGWNSYQMTPKGKIAAEELKGKAKSDPVAKLEDIRDWVKSRSFSNLLKDLYAEYPEFATESLFSL